MMLPRFNDIFAAPAITLMPDAADFEPRDFAAFAGASFRLLPCRRDIFHLRLFVDPPL